jgi:hypothetical protein
MKRWEVNNANVTKKSPSPARRVTGTATARSRSRGRLRWHLRTRTVLGRHVEHADEPDHVLSLEQHLDDAGGDGEGFCRIGAAVHPQFVGCGSPTYSINVYVASGL